MIGYEFQAGTIAGHSVKFVNWTTRTAYRTNEHAELYIDGAYTASGVYRWINRPWQYRDYERADIAAAREETRAHEAQARRDWMASRGYRRMTARRREEWAEEAARPKVHRVTDMTDYGFALAVLCAAHTAGGLLTSSQARPILEALAEVRETRGEHGPVYEFVTASGASFEWAPEYDDITVYVKE